MHLVFFISILLNEIIYVPRTVFDNACHYYYSKNLGQLYNYLYQWFLSRELFIIYTLPSIVGPNLFNRY